MFEFVIYILATYEKIFYLYYMTGHRNLHNFQLQTLFLQYNTWSKHDQLF